MRYPQRPMFMKKLLFLLFIFPVLAYSQSSVNDHSFDNVNSIDTNFYKSGGIQVVTFTFQQSQLILPGHRKLAKLFFQYDQCGNLRNTTYQYRIYIKPDLPGILNPPKYQQEHNLTNNKLCEEEWIQPLFLY